MSNIMCVLLSMIMWRERVCVIVTDRCCMYIYVKKCVARVLNGNGVEMIKGEWMLLIQT